MKKLRHELRYDGATLEQVHQMLTDAAFREQVCETQRVLRHSVSIDRDTDGIAHSIRIDQVQRARKIPAFATKFVGEEINIVQQEDWTSREKGTLHITIPGKPITAEGTALLTEDPQGVTETINLSVKVAVPLVGGKIEALVADLLTRALRAENEAGVRWLAGGPAGSGSP